MFLAPLGFMGVGGVQVGAVGEKEVCVCVGGERGVYPIW